MIIASPNNPVGNILPYSDLQKILADNPSSYVLADEAYYEYAPQPYTELLASFSNLLILRTFSKTMAAAGLRLGYLLASSTFIEEMRKVVVPYLINPFTSIAACEILKSTSALTEMKERTTQMLQERERLFAKISEMQGVDVFPSYANFLLLRWRTQEKCLQAYEALSNSGILLRNVSSGPGLQGCLRLTIGTKADNDRVLETLGKLF